MLAVSAGIGIFYGCFGKKKASAKEMLVANRQMTVWSYIHIKNSDEYNVTIIGFPNSNESFG